MDKVRVLVVDDHEEFRHSLESLLGAMDDVEVVGRAGTAGAPPSWRSASNPTSS